MILYFLATIGLTQIITESKLFESVRNNNKLPPLVRHGLSCHQCMGFWSGLTMGYFLIADDVVMLLTLGCVGSAISMFAASLLNKLER